MADQYEEDLKALKSYQNWFKRQIASKDWDSIADRISDIHAIMIGRLMKAEKPDELNYVIWSQLDFIKDKIREIRKSL